MIHLVISESPNETEILAAKGDGGDPLGRLLGEDGEGGQKGSLTWALWLECRPAAAVAIVTDKERREGSGGAKIRNGRRSSFLNSFIAPCILERFLSLYYPVLCYRYQPCVFWHRCHHRATLQSQWRNQKSQQKITTIQWAQIDECFHALFSGKSAEGSEQVF
ncbi:hypothetical protein MHYP_G00109240 [Metynnis hypsauchen]